MNKRKVRFVVGGIALAALTSVVTLKAIDHYEAKKLAEKRQIHKEFLDNSPFKETLTLNKKERKQKGLPPNKYFEQMWELTINPATGRLDNENITLVQDELIKQREQQNRIPGDGSNAWEERGPNNIGGRTRVMLFDPNDSSNNTVYGGGVSGGLWVNTNITNSSSQWSRVAGVPGNLSVSSITVDPNNSNVWYVGTGEQYTAGDVVGTGVYKTTDGGTTWNSVNIPAAGAATFSFSATNLFLSGIFYVNDVIAWNNGGNTELFVAVGAFVYGDSANPTNWLGLQTAGIYRSTDDGATWARIEQANMSNVQGSETYYYIPNDFEIGADNTLWVGTINNAFGVGGGRVYSTTNGSSWTEAAASPLTDSNRVELEPSTSNANKLYALTQGVSSPVHIYETNNKFGSISTKALPNDVDTGIPANDFTRGQAFYDLIIEADPTNDEIVYVGGIDLFRSTNGADSWTQISKWSNNNNNLAGLGVSLVHADQHAMTFRPGNSNQAVFGTDGGIYYSGNLSGSGSSTSAIGARNNNYNVTQFVKAGIGPDGNGDTNGIFSAGAQDNGTQAFRDGNTSPGINSSEELSDGDGFYTFIDKDGQYAIATFVNNVIYRFNLPWNGLGRRQGGATTLSSSQTTGDFVNQMDYDSDANRLLTNNSSGSSFSIRSINVAANSSGTFTNAALTAKPTAFRASPFANNVWYVGMANGGLVRLSGVTNNSASFTTISTPFVGSVSSVRYGETANDLMVTIHNYGVTSIWYSSDAGANWVSKEGDFPDIPVRDILQNPLNRDEAIIATQLGVWATSNFNASSPNWVQSYNGMSDASVTAFDYWAINGDDNNNQIIASTYGRGVFTGSFTLTSTPDTEAPTAPSSLAASNETENTIDLSWTASTDNVGVTEYEVFQGGSSIATVTGTNYQVTGLAANTSYSFYVVAKDAAGNVSPQSNTVNASTTAPDTTAPSNPTALSSPGNTDTSVDLTWTASTDNVAVTGYDVYQGGSVVGSTANTSFTVTGLAANTAYTFTVRAKDAAGNVSGDSNSVNVTTDSTPITYCASQSSNINDEFIGRVQLNTIDNSSGGQFYTDFTNISTTLTKGNQYTITITPTWTGTIYSEGYSVWIDYNRDGDFTDAGEQVFSQAPTQATPVSGSFTVPAGATETTTRMRVTLSYNAIPTSCQSFTYGEVEDYSIVIEAAGPDTQAPTNPTGLSASNTTETSTDLSWNASTDNVGVTGYDVFQGGSNIASVTGTSYSVTGLTENTSYAFTVRAKDAAGNVSGDSNTADVTTLAAPTCSDGIQNGDETGVDCGGSSCAPCSSSSTVLSASFFETGWDGWVDGGSDSFRYSGSRSYEGSFSIRIRDNSGVASSMTLNNVDLTPYDQVEVEFFFFPNSMENGEDFWLRYFNGSSWTTVATYARGTDFENGTFYTSTITLDASQVNFATNSGFRFQCDASGNNDQIYIDAVTITGITGGSPKADNTYALGLNSGSANGSTNGISDDLIIYPNPVVSTLRINPDYNINETFRIIDLNGKEIMKGRMLNNSINVGTLKTGVYLIELSDEEETFLQKFIKR
jgi:chitodextrinase